MNTIKVILVDDEIHCTETLLMQLQALDTGITVDAVFNNPAEALSYVRRHPFDILFLDIEMPAMNGFELLNQVGDIDFDVVFTTAYNQYAIRAFQYSALNYLLKPVDDEELHTCIQNWVRKKEKQLNRAQFSFFTEMLQQKQHSTQKIALPVTDGFEFIEIREIVRCQADNYYCHFIMKDGKDQLVCRTLKEVEQLLKPLGFIRVHQSHLINPEHIRKFSRNDGGVITTADGAQIGISKSYKAMAANLLDHVHKL